MIDLLKRFRKTWILEFSEKYWAKYQSGEMDVVATNKGEGEKQIFILAAEKPPNVFSSVSKKYFISTETNMFLKRTQIKIIQPMENLRCRQRNRFSGREREISFDCVTISSVCNVSELMAEQCRQYRPECRQCTFLLLHQNWWHRPPFECIQAKYFQNLASLQAHHSYNSGNNTCMKINQTCKKAIPRLVIF